MKDGINPPPKSADNDNKRESARVSIKHVGIHVLSPTKVVGHISLHVDPRVGMVIE